MEKHNPEENIKDMWGKAFDRVESEAKKNILNAYKNITCPGKPKDLDLVVQPREIDVYGNTSKSRPGVTMFEEVGDFNESTVKDTNPKDSVGTKKVPMSTIPGPVMMEVGLGLLEGALKYGRHNYREAGVRASVYMDALERHMLAWWEGEDIDKASGLSHITKAISSLVVLRDSMIRENWVDDRPPKVKDGWIDELNLKAEELIKKYPNPLPAYTQKSLEGK